MNSKKFTSEHVVLETYLDTFGHMNNAKYLSLFEEARWDFITKNGFGIKKMQELGLGPTILEINLRFLKELRVRQPFTIETQIISYQGKVGKIEQRIVDQDNLYCVAEFTIGLFDMASRKLILPTPEWLAAVGLQE